jgi:hypothetical protein
MTCCISSISSICCRSYVSISIVFESYGLYQTYDSQCDDGLVGCTVAGSLREYQISHGVAEFEARSRHGTQDSHQSMVQCHSSREEVVEKHCELRSCQVASLQLVESVHIEPQHNSETISSPGAQPSLIKPIPLLYLSSRNTIRKPSHHQRSHSPL